MMERYMIVRQFGAEVVLTAAGKGFPGLMAAYQELLDSDPSVYFGANQFQNTANPLTHYETTGPEVWSQYALRIGSRTRDDASRLGRC